MCIPCNRGNLNWEPVDPGTNYPVTFSASVASGADPISYLWDFADNTNGTEDVIDHTFTSEQTYNVELTASNCDGASTATVSHDVVVVDPPQITADQSTLDSIQLPDTITSQILELCNSGSYPLTWTLSEAPPFAGISGYTRNKSQNRSYLAIRKPYWRDDTCRLVHTDHNHF